MGEQKKTKSVAKSKKVAEEKEVKQEKKNSLKKINHMENLRNSFASIKWYEWIMVGVMIYVAGLELGKAIAEPNPIGNAMMWLSIIRAFAAICGVFGIILCSKASLSNFAFMIVSSVATITYLSYSKIWGMMLLETLVYIPAALLSWYMWTGFRNKEHPHTVLVRKMDFMQIFVTVIIMISGTGLVYAALLYAGGDLPLYDAFIVTLGIASAFIRILRFKENYYWAIISYAIAVLMFINKFDPVMLTMNTICLISALIGLSNWTRYQKEFNKKNK